MFADTLAPIPGGAAARWQALQYPPDDKGSGDGVAVPRILIVEDEFFIAINAEHWVRQAGYEVVGIADSADEAVTLAANHLPDLVIMDVRLAGSRDGIEAARQIKALLGIPSLIASAHSDEATRKRALPAQPVGWLPKPYGEHDLLSALSLAFARPQDK